MKQLLHTLPGCCVMLFNRQAITHLSVSFFSNKLCDFRYILLVIALCGGTPVLLAQTTWLGAINSDWNNPGNWMPAVVPLAADDVVIPSGGTQPTILSGTAAVAQSVTIASGATLTIQNMASLSIEGDANYAIYNEGSVSNSGTITIGATASPGFYGIQNLGTFNNNTGGNITINRGDIGIRHEMGIFTNAGTIKIGDVALLNSTGVYNEADFQNTATGILEISRTSGSGFYNLATGTLTNAGTITFGKEASISGPGFYNFNTIENNTGATINIDRTFSAAIDNRPNTSFTNEGLIVIGANFSVSGPGIYNQNDATFLNTDGEIRIDRFGGAAIDNRINSIFTTTGLITIGANEATSGPGIYNYGGNFTNDGGEIRIDRVISSGINNAYSSVFVNPNNVYTAGSFSNLNDGIITIGANMASAISGPGIHNDSPFDGSVISTFLNEGTISINRTNFGVHNNYNSSFTNAGDITVGDVAMNGSFGPGITNYGTFMHNAGTIQIDRTATGIHNQPPFNSVATFTNAATIIIGSISDMTSGPGINNLGIFNNTTGGDISIDRVAITNTNTSAIWNSNGSAVMFNNNGVLKIGTLANIGNIGITVESSSTFNNLADGEITIERTAKQGIYNNGIFNNIGNIDIGLTTSIGERGIMAAGTLFKNEGNISIDRASVHGIFAANGTFENSGTIDIGKTIGVGNWGLYNRTTFNNLAGGEINIDNTTMTGLRHDSGTFNNDGTLNVGSLASVGTWGLWNQATFNNNADGEIHVNRTTTSGLHNVNYNGNSLFNNFGKIFIGELAAVGNEALNNYHDPGFNGFNATFRNEACALLEIYAPLDNTDIFVNEGLMRVNTTAAHNNPPGFTNNGVIEYAQINPIPNVINNDVIIEPVNTLCPADVIQIGGMNSFSIATTWYQDEALTMPAGTYDAGTNAFTPAGLSTGPHTLYFEITDDVNTCTQIASIQITIYSMGIIYVDEDATGANNGTSWMDAYNDLQDALAAACSCDGTQIWVADGTYYPDEGVGQTNDDRSSTFQLCNGVVVYGGFSGWSGGTSGGSDETMLSQRNVAANLATLSGDIDKNNTLDNGNAYHVVTGSGTNMTARIDGFTITEGNAIGNSPNNLGGGMYNVSGSPTVANCTFSGNTAQFGGGMYNTGSSPSITNCTFSGNRAYGSGGGMLNISSSPNLTNCTFSGNGAITVVGGGVVNDLSSASFINCTFSGNTSSNTLGGGGAMFNLSNSSTITITNCIFWNNAVDGNTNSANASIGTFNNPTQIISYSLIQNITNNDANNNKDGVTTAGDANYPDFVMPLAPGLNTGGDYRLQISSPAINMGDDMAVPADSKDVDDDGNTAEATPDLDLNDRIMDGQVDLGAFEFNCPDPANFTDNRIYVDVNAVGTNDGTSWTHAFTNLQDALAFACSACPGLPKEIWVADGTYYPDEGVGQTDNDRTSTFQLCNGVAVYGGFAGGETMLSERDILTHIATLSGDLMQNDGANFVNNGENALHVVTGSGTDMTARLDGFTVIAGNANDGNVMFGIFGGGMLNLDGSPSVINCSFVGNSASSGGGGMVNSGGSPDVINCSFSGNSATSGGGMLNNGSAPDVINCTFSGNSATNGGGMLNNGSFPNIINGSFSGNSATSGGGIFDNGGSPNVTNSIIWNNIGGSIIINGSTITISYSLIEGENPAGMGNKDGTLAANDPDFVTPVDPATAPTTAGNLRLLPTSPAINMGDNASVPADSKDVDDDGNTAEPTPDLDLNERIFNDAQDIVDMGAYESQCIDPAGTIAGDIACANENAFLTFTATVGTAPFFVIIDGLNGNNEIMAGAGNGNPIWTFTPGSLAVGDHTFNLLSIRDANGCVFMGNPINSATITINPLPAGTIAGDIACANENAFLTFTATVGTAPFFVIIDGLNGNNEIMAGAGNGNPIWTFTPGSLAVGDHTFELLSIRDANGCVFTADPINTALITINELPAGTISSNFSAICAGESIELRFTATGGVGSFDIVVNGIPYNDVMSGSVFATLNPNSSTDYTLTQITDNNGCIAANLSQAISVTVTNCQVTALDPCTCKNNATTLTNGQFDETIQVMNAPTGQTWTVTAVNGLYDINSAAPPAAPTPIPVGTVLTESPAGSGTYILPGVHVDAQGYTISVSNGRGITFFLGNACVYPNPAITLDPAYCKDDPAILLTGTPGDANIVSQSFKIDGMTATMLDPAALTVGNHTIEYTVDGGKAKEFGPNDPGCIQTVSQQVRIDPQVTVDAGSTQTICRTKTLSLAGLDLTITYTGGNLADLQYSWSIVEAGNNGTLTGTNPTDPKVGTYTPGADAIARGYVTLRLTVDNPNDVCDAVSDTVRVNIQNVDCGAFPWNGN